MKRKLSLQEIRVKSFKTEFEQKNADTVKGGYINTLRTCTFYTVAFKCSIFDCYTDNSFPIPGDEEPAY